MVTSDLQGLAPPGEAVVRAELREPAGVVRTLSSVDLAGGPGDRVPDRCNQPDEPEERHRDSRNAKRPNDRIALFGNEPFDRNRQREREHDGAADDEENREQPPVVLAGGSANPVIDERAPREGPGTHRDAGKRREQDTYRSREAITPEGEGQPDHDDARQQPGPRLRQHQGDDREVHEYRTGHPQASGEADEPEAQHHARVGEERQRGPVTDRLSQPGNAIAVREQRRDRHPEQRPGECDGDHYGEQCGESPAAGSQRAESDAEHDERQVDEPAVEPGPRGVAGDRPTDRHPRPEREACDPNDGREPVPVEAGNGQGAASCGEHDERRRDDRDDPRDGHRPVAGAATMENGQRQQRSDDAAECEGETARRIRGGLGSRRRGLHRGTTLPRAKVHPTVDSQIVYPSLTVDSFAGGRLALRLERSSVTLAPRTSRRFSRTAQTLLIASLVALVAVAASPVAQAKEKKKQNCAQAIIYDWYGDAQIDKRYELHCYKEAIRALPVDIVTYSRASEDILRALAYAKKGLPDPGVAPDQSSTDTNPGSSSGTPPGQGDGTTVTVTSPGETVAEAGDVDTTGPSSIPIPLLVLGGLALLLLAAGGAGYINRRRQAGGPGDGASS